MNFKEEYETKREQIEEILKEYLPPQEGYQKIIMEAMEYSLMAGGKRLRPMLMAETFRLFGGTGNVIRPFMAAIEMIHTYSLVHDDLPAMDNDEYRRGRKQPMWFMGKIWAYWPETLFLTMRLRQRAVPLTRRRSRVRVSDRL